MKTLNQTHADLISSALPNFVPEEPLSDAEFDALARYVAVTREMKQEPFFSEDNWDTVVTVGEGVKKFARFGHPAFVKSAILPFRKLWLESEPCKFEKVRDILFGKYGSMQLDEFLILDGFKSHYKGPHESSLKRLAPEEVRVGKVSTIGDVIEIWIHTHGVHTGKNLHEKKSLGKFTLSDFDAVLRKAGRNDFEFCFRINMLLLAYNSYLHFAEVIAEPIFNYLVEKGRRPDFETEAAFRFNPYEYDGDERLLHDPFWHLDKETEEETFDRLLKRQSFWDLESFFSSYYFKGAGYSKRSALNDTKEYDSFKALLIATGAVLLNEPDETLSFNGSFSAKELGSFSNQHPVRMYADHTIFFGGRALEVLATTFNGFREAFYEHRELVKRSEELRGHDWSWDEDKRGTSSMR